MLLLIFFVILEYCESLPSKSEGPRKKRHSEARMEVLRVDGEGRALVIVVPRDKDNIKKHEIKKLDNNEPELKIQKTNDGLKLIKDDHEFNIDTDAEHKKGNLNA